MATPLLTATPGAPPTYNPAMAETFSWIPVEGAGRPLFAQATYLANPEDIKISLSADNIDLGQLELNTDELESLLRTTNSNLTSIDSDLGTTNTRLQTLINQTDTIEGSIDGIEGLIGTTNSRLQTLINQTDSLETSVDDIEGLIGTTNTNTSTINTNLSTTNTLLRELTSANDIKKIAATALTNTFTVPSAVKLFNIFGMSTAGVGQYIQIYDITGSTPTGTPAGVFFAPANSNFNFDFVKGLPLTSGQALIVNSLTPIDYNAGNSDLFLTVTYN